MENEFGCDSGCRGDGCGCPCHQSAKPKQAGPGSLAERCADAVRTGKLELTPTEAAELKQRLGADAVRYGPEVKPETIAAMCLFGIEVRILPAVPTGPDLSADERPSSDS